MTIGERSTLGVRTRRCLRSQVNRLLVIAGLVTVLPEVALAERWRPGTGSGVARRGVRRIAGACGVRFETRGSGQLDPSGSYVFVANHSSPIDIPAMLLARPDVRFLAAADLFRIPLLALAMRALRTVPIERRDRAVAHQQLAQLASGGEPLCLTVFAEGGIAPAGQRLPFKNGAFVLAIETGATVVPVAIHHSDEVLAPGARLLVSPGTVTVEFLDPIPTNGLSVEDRHLLRDRTRDAILAALDREPATQVGSSSRRAARRPGRR